MSEQSSPPGQFSQPESIEALKKTVSKPGLRRIPLPRARKNPGVRSADTMTEAGRKILRFYFAHMLSHEAGTRLGGDIEELHDMRVATRRIRTAFDVFGPYLKPKVVKKHLKRVRAAGRALGRVRDLDVFMEKVSGYLETLPEGEHTGLDPLLKQWGKKRMQAREKLIAYLDSESCQLFKKEFNEFTASPEGFGRYLSKIHSGPNLVKHAAPMIIYTHLAALRAQGTLTQNAALSELHALRIETKKLRYALEFFHEVLGEDGKEVIVELKIVQDHLGALNDANVACQILSEFIQVAESRQDELPLNERQSLEPAVAFLAAKHAERHHLVVTFPRIWKHFDRRENMRRIALAISGL